MGAASKGEARPVAVVVGCGEIGSAVAIALHRAGQAVVLIDEADPGWPRRGMSFTNAWYVGNAELDGEEAVFCASLRTIPTLLAGRTSIAATTWSWPGVAEALRPVALVDTRPAARHGAPARRLRLDGALAIGVGPGYTAGTNVDCVVQRAVEDPAGDAREAERAARCVRAKDTGRFQTSCRIGERVRQGQLVGALGSAPVLAPAPGVLRGLSARGARIDAGDEIVEVDPRAEPEDCFGLETSARLTAERVLEALSRLAPDAVGPAD